MKVIKKDIGKSQIKLTVEVPKEKVEEGLEKAYLQLAPSVKIPGFRPGKAPKFMIIQEIGHGKLHARTMEILMPETYFEAIKQEKIAPIAKPQVEVKKFAPGNPFEYEATVAVMPEVKLPDYEKIKIGRKEAKVEQGQIDMVLNDLAKKHAKLSPKEKDGKSEKGDWAEIDFDVSVDGKIIEGGQSKNYPLIIGDNIFVPGFEDHIIGLAEDEEKEFELTFPKDYFKKELSGKKANFKVKVNKIQSVELPEMNDEFAKKAGESKSIDELRENIKKDLEKRTEASIRQAEEGEIIKSIVEKTRVGIPDILIDEEVGGMTRELEQRLSSRGLGFDQYLAHLKKTKEELERDMRPEAEKRIKISLVLFEVSKKENVKIDENEIKEEIKRIKKTPDMPEEDKAKLETESNKRYIENVLRNKKTIERLRKLIIK